AADAPVHRGAWRQRRSQVEEGQGHDRHAHGTARRQMILADEDATAQLGAQLALVARPGDVITLSGPLGVGKTALARGFIAALGHSGEAPSPDVAIGHLY